ncbi:MAG: hypothetical protein HQK57_13075 [Deltaproteobacteria bacterium]|nr:hypothetical protein [Deltaproteobacteria bacterium]
MIMYPVFVGRQHGVANFRPKRFDGGMVIRLLTIVYYSNFDFSKHDFCF